MLGCILLPGPARLLTRAAGTALYLVAGVALLPAAYALAFEALRQADAVAGLLLGGLHATAAGVGLAAVGRITRCPRDAGISSPGLFGWRLGAFTPPGLVVAHLFYGAFLGFVYAGPGL